MDYSKVLKRSWHMVTRYRALWIFGIVLGIVTFSWKWALLSDRDDENQYSQGIVITPLAGETFYDALQRTLQKELDWAEQDLSNALRELDRLFTTELGPGIPGSRFVVDIMTILAVLAATFVITLIASNTNCLIKNRERKLPLSRPGSHARQTAAWEPPPLERTAAYWSKIHGP